MTISQSTSFFTILSLYTRLRRSGSGESEAQEKLRGLARQLSSVDRPMLIKAVNDWEVRHGSQIGRATYAKADYWPARVILPGAAQAHDVLDSDQINSANLDTPLMPLRRVVSCSGCGKKNDSAKLTCVYCGKPLEPAAVVQSSASVETTWFGPDSKLVLTISDTSYLLEIPVQGIVTFGRYSPCGPLVDIDLTAYQADVHGVSRLHASVERQRNTLTLTDLQSKNHTFVNGNQLRDGQVYTLRTDDRIHLGKLGFTIKFRHTR